MEGKKRQQQGSTANLVSGRRHVELFYGNFGGRIEKRKERLK